MRCYVMTTERRNGQQVDTTTLGASRARRGGRGCAAGRGAKYGGVVLDYI